MKVPKKPRKIVWNEIQRILTIMNKITANRERERQRVLKLRVTLCPHDDRQITNVQLINQIEWVCKIIVQLLLTTVELNPKN